jgi:hypothetical protein
MYRQSKLRQTTGSNLPARLLRWPQLKPTGLHEFRGDSLVLFLMIRAGQALFSSRGTVSWLTDRCALICLTMLTAWMLVYPVIYEPVTGSLLWLIVGYGNRQHQPSVVTQNA